MEIVNGPAKANHHRFQLGDQDVLNYHFHYHPDQLYEVCSTLVACVRAFRPPLRSWGFGRDLSKMAIPPSSVFHLLYQGFKVNEKHCLCCFVFVVEQLDADSIVFVASVCAENALEQVLCALSNDEARIVLSIRCKLCNFVRYQERLQLSHCPDVYTLLLQLVSPSEP